VQAANYLVPLLTIPYLTRVLGAEAYGKVIFVQLVMTFLIQFVDFGFAYSATHKVSLSRNDKEVLSQIFIPTWTAQWILLAFAAIGMGLVLRGIGIGDETLQVYVYGFGLVIGYVLLPAWLLQGVEALRAMAIIQLCSKMLVLPMLFWTVKSSADILNAMACFSISAILGGVIALGWIVRNRILRWQRPNISAVKSAFASSIGLFGSKISVSLYTTLVPLVLGTFGGATQLAYFNLADKLKTASQSMLAPVSQALFPRMSLLYKEDVNAANALARRSAMFLLIIAGAGGIFIFVFAEYIAALLGGPEFAGAVPCLRALGFVPLATALSNTLGIQVMLPNGMSKAFTAIVSAASLICLVLVIPVTEFGAATGVAVLVLAIEIFVAVAMASYLKFIRRP
jgi:PST family polysaccharide transporter